jgi:REP element-mobilizing transposase RayT
MNGYKRRVEVRARRPRKTHEQLPLFRNGGKRRGAGRKPAGPRAGTSHHSRPEFEATDPLHITLRIAADLGNMRRPAMYKAVRTASQVAARRDEFRIVHLSIQGNHVHLLAEASNKRELARGMQGFLISAARHINAAAGDKHHRRRGRVFTDRYHLVVVGSPTQMRHVLAYCMNNWRKHQADRGMPGWLVDPYATGFAFRGWRELESGTPLWPPGTYDRIVVKEPRSWLLRDGWRRGGSGSISVYEVPGGRDD